MKSCRGKVLATKKMSIPISMKEKTIDVINCEVCGYGHIQPMPREDELSKYYEFHFYDKEKPEYLSKMETETDYWLRWYGLRIQHIESLLSTIPLLKNSKKCRLLDVGSSGGFFLEAGHRRGWKVLGIEPSGQAADYCRHHFGHEVIMSSFEDSHIDAHSIDAIHCSLVLEHLRNPGSFLNWAKSVMKPGGILCIEVPNEFNRLQNILVDHLKKEPWYVSFPDHINYFIPTTLRHLASTHGLEEVDMIATFPIELFVLMGDDYIGKDEVGRECHKRRMRFEQNLIESGNASLLLEMYRSLGELSIGREIIAFFTPCTKLT